MSLKMLLCIAIKTSFLKICLIRQSIYTYWIHSNHCCLLVCGGPSEMTHLSDKKFGPKISFYQSKFHKYNLSKADTCLKLTKILVPKILVRFRQVSLYLCEEIYHQLESPHVLLCSFLVLSSARSIVIRQFTQRIENHCSLYDLTS